MNSIIVLYDLMEPPVEITRQFFQRFTEIYKVNVLFIKSSDITVKDLNACRVLMVIRSQSMFLADISRIIKKSGRTLIAVYDDDFLAIKDYHIRRKIQKKAIIKTLRNTSILFSTNSSLLEKYEIIGGIERCVKTDTGVIESDIKRPRNHKIGDIIRIVYYCNDGTTAVFDEVIGNIMPEIINYFGDLFEWTLIGTKPIFHKCVDDKHIHYINHLSLDEFHNELRERDYTFGIAPLLEDEFSGHKYINKFIEFTTAGIPCIYSDVSPYKEFIVHMTDGVLCENSANGWIKAIEYMLEENNRKKIIDSAQKRIVEVFSVQSICRRIVNEVPELVGKQLKQLKKITFIDLWFAQTRNFVYMIVDPFSRAIGRIKVEGIKSLLKYSIMRLMKHEVT